MNCSCEKRPCDIVVRAFSRSPFTPEYETPGSSGMDVRSIEDDYVLAPGSYHAFETGLHVEIPDGYEIQVRPRSGLAAKHGVTVLNSPGTVDSSFRGEIKVILINHGYTPFDVTSGMRIAQLVVAKVERAEFNWVESPEELSETKRGSGGFGSTGLT